MTPESTIGHPPEMAPRLPKADPVLERVTLSVAGAHIALAVIMIAGKAGFGRRAEGLVPSVAENPMWIVANLVAGVLVVGALIRRHWRRHALTFSTGVFAGWSILMGAWAVQLTPDATWAVTLLGLALSLVSFVTNGQWSVRED